MNNQLSIHTESHVWQLDSATRRRGLNGVSEARKAISRARSREIGASASRIDATSLIRSSPDAHGAPQMAVEAA